MKVVVEVEAEFEVKVEVVEMEMMDVLKVVAMEVVVGRRMMWWIWRCC